MENIRENVRDEMQDVFDLELRHMFDNIIFDTMLLLINYNELRDLSFEIQFYY